MTLEAYQIKSVQQPTGPVIALDLLATVTSAASITGGILHVANSVYCHFDLDSAYETATIPVTPTEGVTYTLTVGAVVLTGTPLDATPTLAELVTTLQNDADYAAAPFTVAVDGTTGVVVTWDALGNQTDAAALTDDAAGVYVTTVSNGAVVSTTCGMLAAGERTIIIPAGRTISFVKAAGAADGVIRLTYCE